jgi:4-methyl-5(b-hydroxyethyl)-thiazole monophosphate biosynthesis
MPGAEKLAASSPLIEMLSSQAKSGELYGAICASPAVVLEPNDLLQGKCATCHPAFMQGLSTPSEARVVLHDNCITSRGPGTTFEFALCVVCILLGPHKMGKVAGPMMLPKTLSLEDIAQKLSSS